VTSAGSPRSDADEVLTLVEAHLLAALGHDSGRAGVTFLGTERIDVLRFGPDGDGVTRYVTLGASRAPMADPASPVADPVAGPRAELVLSVRGRPDSVLRRLAVLAAAPAVEGIVLMPGTVLEVGEPLWEGARFAAVLVAEPGGLIADLALDEGRDPVRFCPVLPLTANEAAYKRLHGATALEEGWLHAGTDLRDPSRPELPAASGR
jgi:Suppressor of fused protein (SUFU)